MANNAKLTVRMDRGLLRKAQKIARAERMSVSALVREALTLHLIRQGHAPLTDWLKLRRANSKWEATLPTDLSTNPKYMEGFGRDE